MIFIFTAFGLALIAFAVAAAIETTSPPGGASFLTDANSILPPGALLKLNPSVVRL